MSGERKRERELIVAYLRDLASLRPKDADGLRVAAADIEAEFHLDPELNPAARGGTVQ